MQNKQREFLKQREKLKYVTQNTIAKKALDPDIMIEQLISDKETFKFNLESPLPYTVPKWLKVENNLVPAVYEQVWQAVKLGPNFQYCDTIIITHLFTTSGLSFEKLGYLWSLTNVSSPGFLTRQELYIMLALIALIQVVIWHVLNSIDFLKLLETLFFQTGYHVHDIGILNSINHPILPQLDYSFLNIMVANPAINRSTKNNDVNYAHSIVYNGFSSVPPSNSVPLHVKPLHDPASSQLSPKNPDALLSSLYVDSMKNNSSFSIESLKNNLSLNVGPVRNSFLPSVPQNLRKSDMDVSFAIPERSKIDVSLNFAPQAPITELDVDFPVPSIQMELKSAPPKSRTNLVAETRKVDFDAHFGNSNICNHFGENSLTIGLEPQSLDLPVFNEPAAPPDEDEFTEFQSATIPTIDEYSDFQSASPIVKNELQNSAAGKLPPFDLNVKFELLNSLNSISLPTNSMVKNEIHVENPSPFFNLKVSSSLKVETEEINLLKDEPLNHKTYAEADKYDVFRTLMEPSEEVKIQPSAASCNEDDEEDEFGDFCTADVKQNEEKCDLSIKDKCLEACLRLLQEGLHIFSSITNERTIMEVLSDERGCRYFYQLKIVYDTSQRFQRQCESTDLNDSIQSTWAKLSKYTKYIPNEDLLDEMPSENDVDTIPCKLCETKCDVNCVRYAGNNYHVTCLNLFLHFVEDSEITAMLNI